MLPDRAVLRLTGADVRPFLQGLLTNDIAALAPGQPLYAGLLSAQGKLLYALLLYDGADANAPDEVLIDVDAAQLPALARRLGLYRMRKAVTITPAPEFAVWVDANATDRPDPRTPALGARWIAPTDAQAPDGSAAYRAHRFALGIAEAAELGEEELLWLETGAAFLNGVSFTKGCYVGQENTARMQHREKVRKMIVPARLSGDASSKYLGDGVVRDAAGRQQGQLRGTPEGNLGLLHLRLEAMDSQLFIGEAVPLNILQPDWLAKLPTRTNAET